MVVVDGSAAYTSCRLDYDSTRHAQQCMNCLTLTIRSRLASFSLPHSRIVDMDVPSLKSTMSQVSPAKAAQIRSAVTGDLTRNSSSGLLCFERTVETTFVLPWDLNPKVQP